MRLTENNTTDMNNICDYDTYTLERHWEAHNSSQGRGCRLLFSAANIQRNSDAKPK